MALELGGLCKAISAMERMVNVALRKDYTNTPLDELEAIKGGVIQSFEYTYELCWKHMKRWLEMNLTPSMMEGISRKQLFRYAAENGLITEFDAWMLYHDLRNKTSHTYDEAVAQEIYQHSEAFLRDAQAFLRALEARND